MKVLAAFVVALLSCGLAEGRIVPKCELRDQLLAAIGELSTDENHQVLTGSNDVAQFVCHAEKSSGFNTSAEKELPAGTEDPDHKPGEDWPQPAQQQSNDPAAFHIQKPPQPWTLLGVFGFSNRLFCDDGVNKSLNICQSPCSKFRDDDVSDDARCLLKFFLNTGASATQLSISDLLKMVHLILESDCRDVQDSEYFAGCPPPPAPHN